jgi:murein DD-endopeptidase MepM/ murein hydrolase activator NlpD
MKAFILFLLSILCACASAHNRQQHTIRPGEVRLIEFEVKGPQTKLTCRDGERVGFSRKEAKGTAVIIESYFSELKPFTCRVEEAGKLIELISFTVEDKAFKEEKLNVNMKTIKLSKKDQARADREQLVLNKIYASSLPDFQFRQPFIQPLNNPITSVYGTRRVYNNAKKGQHLGTDYRAFVGEKVPATNRGKVVFSGDLFYTGGTVIIDHGLNIFTVYGHLSQTIAKEGTMVERGDVIALSGNTGRTSGPHLHWGVKVQGQYIDGHSLIEETKRIFPE